MSKTGTASLRAVRGHTRRTRRLQAYAGKSKGMNLWAPKKGEITGSGFILLGRGAQAE